MALRENKALVKQVNTALMAQNAQRWIGDALPLSVRKYLTPQRMARVVLSTFRKSPTLWSCSVESIILAVIDAASLGIEPVGGTLAHGYLVPYKGECQFIVGYQGLIELARRSKEFRSIEANTVHENDGLVLRFGFDAAFEHSPYIGKDQRGEVIGAYCMATFATGERHLTWMSRQEIDKRRAASQTGRADRGPWAEWFEEMCVKTVIRKAAKHWPKTTEILDAMSIDEGGRSFAASNVIDAKLEEDGVNDTQRPSRTDYLADRLLREASASAEMSDGEGRDVLPEQSEELLERDS